MTLEKKNYFQRKITCRGIIETIQFSRICQAILIINLFHALHNFANLE